MQFSDLRRRKMANTVAAAIFWGVIVTSAIVFFDVWAGQALALGIAAFVITLIWGYRPRRSVAVLSLGLAAILLWLSFWFQPAPSIDDVRMEFIPDKVVGQSVFGRVVMQNNADEPLHIRAFRIVYPPAGASIQLSASATAQPGGGSSSFPLDERNTLANGGRIDFEAHYAFGDTEAKEAAWALFVIPPGITVGEPVRALGCCKKTKTDLAAAVKEYDWTILNRPEGTHPVGLVPEKTVDGRPNRRWARYPRREEIFDPVERVVRYRSILRDGQWHEISTPLEYTFDGKHDLRFRWHEPNGFMGLTVDNVDVTFDLDDGKVESRALGK